MKKFLAILMAATLMFALAIPSLADETEEPIFNSAFNLVENEPVIEYDEYNVPYNVWVPISNETALTIGEEVTFVLTYSVPTAEELPDYDARLLDSIEYLVNITGVDELELEEAQGCPLKMECDYDLGFCMPIWGEYSNVTLEGNNCTIMAELDSDVTIVFKGIATAETINCTANITIGQYRFPAQFSIGDSIVTVEKNEEGYYNAHRSDFILVQKRSVEYRNVEGACQKFVGRNDHYYRLVEGAEAIESFIPVDENFADNGDPITSENEMFATLISIFNEYEELFGITYNQTLVADEDFIGEAIHYTFPIAAELGGDGAPEPTEDPVEPTEAPEDPTTPDPNAPEVPDTGAISLAVVGIASVIGGAAILLGKKKED